MKSNPFKIWPSAKMDFASALMTSGKPFIAVAKRFGCTVEEVKWQFAKHEEINKAQDALELEDKLSATVDVEAEMIAAMGKTSAAFVMAGQSLDGLCKQFDVLQEVFSTPCSLVKLEKEIQALLDNKYKRDEGESFAHYAARVIYNQYILLLREGPDESKQKRTNGGEAGATLGMGEAEAGSSSHCETTR